LVMQRRQRLSINRCLHPHPNLPPWTEWGKGKSRPFPHGLNGERKEQILPPWTELGKGKSSTLRLWEMMRKGKSVSVLASRMVMIHGALFPHTT
jgi:hypothetical protein